MAGGAVGGFLGAFFALPIAATIQEFMSAYGTTYEVAESSLTHVDEPEDEEEPDQDSPPDDGAR
jgi:predicted PurR-regulated permease PerM